MCTPYCTLDRRRFWLRMIGMLLSLSASCFFRLQLHASLPRTYNELFSLMRANCLCLRHPADIADGWFSPVQAVSSAGLCNAFLEHHDHTFLLGARWRRLLWAHVRLPYLWRGQPSASVGEARWTLCWAGWFSWADCNVVYNYIETSFTCSFHITILSLLRQTAQRERKETYFGDGTQQIKVHNFGKNTFSRSLNS